MRRETLIAIGATYLVAGSVGLTFAAIWHGQSNPIALAALSGWSLRAGFLYLGKAV